MILRMGLAAFTVWPKGNTLLEIARGPEWQVHSILQIEFTAGRSTILAMHRRASRIGSWELWHCIAWMLLSNESNRSSQYTLRHSILGPQTPSMASKMILELLHESISRPVISLKIANFGVVDGSWCLELPRIDGITPSVVLWRCHNPFRIAPDLLVYIFLNCGAAAWGCHRATGVLWCSQDDIRSMHLLTCLQNTHHLRTKANFRSMDSGVRRGHQRPRNSLQHNKGSDSMEQDMRRCWP